MTQTTSNTAKEKLDKKFKKAEAYLKRNGFSSSITTLFGDMERCEKKYLKKHLNVNDF